MNKYKNRLMSKNGIAIISLAQKLFTLDVGDRIKTVQQYSEELSLGRGTIHSALKFLEEEKSISLESRGHLGTYLNFIDHKKLWTIADMDTIMGVMPLPYSKRYEGLATGLYKSFKDADLPFSLAYMRGSSKRTEGLNSKIYDFAILSKLAAKLQMERYGNIEIAYEFPQNSYVDSHVVIFGDKKQTKIVPGMRVGIDPDSLDQIILTNYECDGIEVEFVEISYAQIFNNIKNNVIDAAIWNGDELGEEAGNYGIAPLRNRKSTGLTKEDTIAVIVINKDNNMIKELLSKSIDFEQISGIQGEVMNDKMIPTY